MSLLGVSSSDIFNENIQKINQKSFYFLNFGAKRRIYFLTFLIYFLKNRAGEKNVLFFEYFQKIKRFHHIFDQKTLKIVLFFDLFFEKLVFENR